MTQTSAVDYRTANGTSRRHEAESVLDKYIRVARVEANHLSQSYPLPIARPEIGCPMTFGDYGLLLDVLDELFILEAAARYADRKSGDIARRRLYNALSITTGYEPQQIENLFTNVGRAEIPVLRAVARAILPERSDDDGSTLPLPQGGGTVIQFPRM